MARNSEPKDLDDEANLTKPTIKPIGTDITRHQHRVLTQNIRNVYHATPEEVRGAALHWYDRVNEATAKGVRGTSTSERGGAGLVAAVSPNMDWDNNNIHAISELHHLNSAQFAQIAKGDRSPLQGMSISRAPSSNILKAQQIMDGHDPADILKAPKTFHFFQNIHEPQSRTGVTIDGRAHDIGRGALQGWSENRGISGQMYTKRGAPTANHQRYMHFENAYTSAARIETRESGREILPHQMQAMTWEGGKLLEKAGYTQKGTPRLKGVTRRGQPYL